MVTARYRYYFRAYLMQDYYIAKDIITDLYLDKGRFEILESC